MSSPDLRTRIVSDEAEWDAIRPAWVDLHGASPAASPFLRFGWLRRWWQWFGPTYGEGGLRLITIWQDGALAGALPLYVATGHAGFRLRCLRFVSTGEAEFEETCPEYLDLLSRPGVEAACAAAAWKAIDGMRWDTLELLDVPAESVLLRHRPSGAAAVPFSTGTCPIADLQGGFDAYLSRLSSNSRQTARRLLRAAQAPGVQFSLVDSAGLHPAFTEMVELHRERWAAEGKPGAFSSARFTDFHRSLVEAWLPDASAVIARLSFYDTPFALVYGFVTDRRFYLYQSGVKRETEGPFRSPGNLAHLLLMRTLADRGIVAYDFLKGAATYKDRLATTATGLVGIRLRRPTLRSAASWPFQIAGRLAHRGIDLANGVRP